ncbi:monofunctional biosynthetic peptidoglycan transglycosylase [Luteimonas soli]|uniref:Biosynthetic peptidoglycan transglycosylase n=1 Tax=Luteimonas soli TaxID=1648966 RepID=A0ABV7XL43_9GAMM
MGMTAKTERQRRSGVRRWLRWLWKLPLLLVALSVLQVLALRFVDPPFSAFMAARQVQAWMAGDGSFRIAYDWRDLDEIAPSLPLSMIAAEDQNFARHRGFDLEAIEKARASNARGGRLRGASTISQQVAKNVFLWSGDSRASRWARKGVEAWYTVLIEALWPKTRILEVYANVAEFGDGIYGAQAAARSYWRRDAARLTPAQSATLAAVLPNPKEYSAARPGPYVQRRARWIERNVRRIGGVGYLDNL